MAHLYTSSSSLESTISIDDLIYTGIFSQDSVIKSKSLNRIFQLAQENGCIASSIYPLYQAIGKGSIKGFVVPALNIRTLTYDIACLIFRMMHKYQIGPVIFEIAPSEMEYTNQSPNEFSSCVLAAALHENYQGPVFLQGDHFQLKQDAFVLDEAKELQRLQSLILDAIQAKFYNIDIDASTLVDLSLPSLTDQQRENSKITSLLTDFIRSHQPDNVDISIGGEIGHIGDRNSTLADFEAFMQLYQQNRHGHGLSKVSIQTGSTHGGNPLPDGTLQSVIIDFDILNSIGKTARGNYNLAGVVQHAASTLPLNIFDKFVTNNTIEIHLATGLQNIIFDTLPEAIRKDMQDWLINTHKSSLLPNQTIEQFFYKNRKKAFGQFKKQLWDISDQDKNKIINKLEEFLLPIFTKLHILQTKTTILPYYV